MSEKSPLTILVMGAGAVGSTVGGFLSKAGHDVHLVGRAAHMSAIRDNGLRITGIWGDHHITSLHTHTSIEQVPDLSIDLVLLSVKGFDTEAALKALHPQISEHTLIASVQNGLGNAERIAEHYGWDRCIESRVMFGAVIHELGSVDITVMAHRAAFGTYQKSPHEERIKAIAEAIDSAGVPADYAENIATLLWLKFAYNCALNPLSALLDVPYGKLVESEDTLDTMREVINELYAVGNALGVELDPLTAETYFDLFVNTLVPPTAGHYASTREDFRRKRRSEIDTLNGAIVAHGKQLGIPTPINKWLTQRVKDHEKEYLN